LAVFAGIDLGIIEECQGPYPEPKTRQVSGYPGVNGLELLDLGSRGLKASLRGVLLAASPAALSWAKQTLGGLVLDGGPYPFLDPDGTLWVGVVMTAWRPVGPRYLLAGGLGVAQRYDAEFLHPDA
jgi:hypothetical protein